MDNKQLQIIVEDLSSIEQDTTVPRNARERIKIAIGILSTNDKSMNLRIDKSIQELGDVAEDPNVPQYTKIQIWSVVSQLESE